MNPLVQRLTESKAEPLPVIVDSKPIEFWRCPHCKEEIHEKHMFYENGVDYHRDCGGALKLPPTDWTKVSPEWRALLEPYIKETRGDTGTAK